jgi:hypothetical protein
MEVALAGATLFITRDAVFHVTGYSVALLCSREKVEQYVCPVHSDARR